MESVERSTVLPDHLLRPAGRRWAHWRRVLLRSAGFPAELALAVGSPECAAAADRIFDAESRREEARRQAAERVGQALDALRAEGRWEDEERRKPLVNAQRALAKGNAAKARDLAASLPDAARGAVEAFLLAGSDCAAARAELAAAYEGALLDQSEAIKRTASHPGFQEAVIWQNRGAYGRAVEKLEEQPAAGRTHRQRRREELAASYLQRYCLKNDTIGFFGPTAWGRFVDSGPALTCRPGAGLIRERETVLEDWCVDEVGKALLARHAEMRRWLTPRRLSSVGLHGTTLYLPEQPPRQIPAEMACLIEACDGRRTASVLAAELAADPGSGFATPEDVHRMLGELLAQNLIAWGFDIPIGPQALAELRRQVEGIGDEELRRHGLEVVEELESCRRELAAAAGDAERLNSAIGRLEETFTRFTGTPATRRAGLTYGGRTLVYEECLRDLDFDLGPELFEEIAKPLSLIVDGTRWCMDRTAEKFRAIAQALYQDLAREMGTPLVHIGMLWGRIAPYLFGPLRAELQAAIPEMQQRWHWILAVDPAARHVHFTSAELAPRVAEAFATRDDFVPLSLYHAPDLMIAAPSVDAIRRGEYQLVLGEMHPGRNTLNTWVFMTLAPGRDELFADIDRDIPQPQVVPLPPRANNRITTRTHRAHLSAKDIFLTPPDGSAMVPPHRVLKFSDIVVEDTGEGLVVRSFDGPLRFSILEFFNELILVTLVNSFSLLGKADHWPRITVDRMILQRESWSVPPEVLGFADLEDPSVRFLEARRWARERGLPRFVFVKTPAEQKPFYVDFASPIYIDLLVKSIRASREATPETPEAPAITFSEMVPAPDQLWTVDAEGRRYTSELRMVVVDQVERLDGAAEATA